MIFNRNIIVFVVAFLNAVTLCGQSPLVRQTLSSAGGTAYCSIESQQLMVQQSIGQLSVTGLWRSAHAEVRQGFIQPPVKARAVILQEELQVVAYPNPTYDLLYFNFSESPGSVMLELFDVSGRFLFQRNYPNGATVTCDLSDLASGCYMVKVRAGGRIKTLQIQHL